MKKRILSMILTLCIVTTMLLPAGNTAFAADIQAGIGTPSVNNSQDHTTKIYYGSYGGSPLEWYVVGYNGDHVASEIGTVTLFALNAIGPQSKYHTSNAEYAGSDLQTAVDALASDNTGIFSAKEKAAIKPRSLDDIGESAVDNAVLWPPGLNEVTLARLDYILCAISIDWWLRTNANINLAWYFDRSYTIVNADDIKSSKGVRPAFRLNLSSVLLSSAANGTSAKPTAVSSALTSVKASSGTLKVTILDDFNETTNPSGQTVTINSTSRSDNTITINYSNAKTGIGQYLSAIVKDNSDDVKFYGKIADTRITPNGTATVTLPSGFTTNMKLEVFSEQANGDNLTDYASTPYLIDTTAPTVSSANPSTSAALSGNIEITFSEAMDTSVGIVSLDPMGTLSSGSWNTPTNTIYTIPYSGLAYDSNYKVMISGFRDVNGNQLAEDFRNIKTVVQPVSATPTTANATLSKTAVTQSSVQFTLTNTPAYANGLSWKVYNVATNGTALAEVTAAYDTGENKLTLSHLTDIPSGTYYVSVTETDKAESLRLALTVNDYVPPIDVTDVTLSPTTLSLYKNTTPNTAILTPIIAPSNATNKDVTWSSNNSAVATVSNGVVTAVGNGTAIITVTTVDGNKSATCAVTVSTYSGGGYSSTGGGYSNTVYRFLSGANSKFVKGNGTGLTVEVDASYNKFYGVRMDGSTVPSTNLTVKSGSTIVTLKPEYLETLSLGKHTMRILFSDGYAETNLTVLDKQDTPPKTENPNISANNPFVDVRESDRFFYAVMIVYHQGLFAGTSANTFSPQMSMTRGMFATVLSRLDGADLTRYNVSPFDDVAITEYYARPIAWAANNGIVTGIGDNRFAPDKSITREEMAIILANYIRDKSLKLPQNGSVTPFSDSDEFSPWAAKAIADMRRLGLINGKGNNSYDPQGKATRAEVAQIILNLLNVMEK